MMQPTVLTKAEATPPLIPQKAPSADKATPSLKTPSASASVVDKHEHQDNEWDDSHSLYEELLDDSEAYDYTSGMCFSFNC
jgi:hypothetical protein